MSRIVFPRPLQALLEHSPLLAPLRAFADRAGEIFADNKLPFFPDYTDHGIEHITRVLASQVDLIPDAIWTRSTPDASPRLLCDADAAVIIGATILHDIAMHLRPDGFLELISANTRFQPLPWFRDRHDERSEDRPWPDLWNEYILEARRLSDRQLANIIGEDSVQDGWKFQGLPERTGQWQRNDCLVIGEFTRRHHARLAHEIAIYGFPGSPVGMGDGEFPALGDARGPYPLTQLADLIGLVARSHGTTLRVCKAYLDAHPLYADTPRPEDAAVLYPMALLRVADFLQIDRQRAPAVLLGLRNPQSPISVREWAKHRAVRNIAWGSDPCAVMVTVDTNISLSLFLQIQELLESLQQEIDHSTAALDETYGPLTHLGLEQLGLTLRRVRSNITRRTFLDRLPYVPERVGFSADPNVLALLVEPLYGREPGVGVRELMQNAVDAVRELHAWCVLKGRSIDSIGRADHEGDVLVEFVQEHKDGPWVLRVRDKGIGMTADTIQRYLLRAGASFRRSPEWANEFLGNDGHPNVIRAGRFGVGAFATFLLGHRFRLWTRHVTATAAQGCAIEATADADLIEIRREKIDPVGTTVEVELSAEAAAILKLGGSERDAERILNERTDWFCWDWPRVIRRVVSQGKAKRLSQMYSAPISGGGAADGWCTIHPDDFDAVHWTLADAPSLSCNGIKIEDPAMGPYGDRFNWTRDVRVQAPKVAVVDSRGHLPLTVQRYGLAQRTLPFMEELARDVALSFVAHGLVLGPASSADPAVQGYRRTQYPLALGETAPAQPGDSIGPPNLRWCSTALGIVPADPWLYALLRASHCIVSGGVPFHSDRGLLLKFVHTRAGDIALVHWDIQERSDVPDEGPNDRWVLSKAVSVADTVARYLGQGAVGARVSLFLESGANWEDEEWIEEGAEWRMCEQQPFGRYFELRQGSTEQLPPLRDIADLERFAQHVEEFDNYDVFTETFVAQLQLTNQPHQPESLIARIWNECLGPSIIPFDPASRRALIEKGRRHAELRRHIEYWERTRQQ